MELSSFVRKPFLIDAVEITETNIEELAEHIGTLRRKKNGTPYIDVNPTLVPKVSQVYPGFWLTKMDHNIRCYSSRTFKEQFVPNTPDIETWVDYLNKQSEKNETSSSI